jgi:hypothetical protein
LTPSTTALSLALQRFSHAESSLPSSPVLHIHRARPQSVFTAAAVCETHLYCGWNLRVTWLGLDLAEHALCVSSAHVRMIEISFTRECCKRGV